MSVPSSAAPASTIEPVKLVGINAWLIRFSVERAETRARHGRPRWSLSTGMRPRSICQK